MRAVLFPGQGSQYVGMGSDFYEKFDLVKTIFKTVDKTLGFSLSDIILNGPEEKLKLTQNTQPAIMTIGVSIFNVLNEQYNLNLNQSKFFAGHSLGEYTALVCAGSLKIDRAVYLLHERGKAMQSAVPADQGAMMAIIGMTINEIEKEINTLSKEEACEIANDNSNGQVVVSGKKKSIEVFRDILKKKNKKCILLPVSAPFHCSLMKAARDKMDEKIKNTSFKNPQISLVANVTAKKVNDSEEIKNLLVKQIVSRVRWRESVLYMIQNGVNEFIEIGPGKVLSGLVKRISDKVSSKSINTIEEIKNLK